MLYLLLAIASSAMISVIMRISGRTVRSNFSMLAVNYVTCLALSAAYADQFLFYTFVSALLLCSVPVFLKKERPDKNALIFGVLVGIPNFFCAKFLLMALQSLPGVIVYPTFSVGTILAVTLAGTLLFRERLGKLQWAALTVILAALILLNI